MRRVARRRAVLVAFDPEVAAELWIVRDYLPEAVSHHLCRHPSMAHLLDALPGATVRPLLAARDCTDRMFATLWARPEQYLDPQVREATSTWDQLPLAATDRALKRLRTEPRFRQVGRATGISARHRCATSVSVSYEPNIRHAARA